MGRAEIKDFGVRNDGLRKLLRGVQVPPGGYSDRFRPRTHALSGPEQRGIDLGKFHFLTKNHVWA